MINWGDVDSEMAEMSKWARDYYNLPNLKVRIRLDPNMTRNRSWGGLRRHNGVEKGYISISTRRVRIQAEWGETGEYKRIYFDPQIGNIKLCLTDGIAKNEKVVFLTMFAHELAHTIHYYLWWLEKRETDRKPHGKAWQQIYRNLRIRFVNSKVGVVK